MRLPLSLKPEQGICFVDEDGISIRPGMQSQEGVYHRDIEMPAIKQVTYW